MPPDMEVSMRHTKLKPEEAALLAGEISKPTWESRNEGIHERVSFEDSIWGFDLAGGAFYKTPLRVTYVKPDSRASKAGIRAGDKLLRINDIDTSTLTIQEAHDIIISSGIHLKLSVTAPEDEEDAYYCYQDPLVDGYDSDEERRLEEERAAKRRVHAKVSSYWSLQWPWVSKKRLIYRESNCFMVNSKYEEARREKYPPLPVLRYTDDLLLYQRDGDKDKIDNSKKEPPSLKELKDNYRSSQQKKLANENIQKDGKQAVEELVNHDNENSEVENHDSSISPVIEENDLEEVIENDHSEKPSIEGLEENGDDRLSNSPTAKEINEDNGDDSNVNGTVANEMNEENVYNGNVNSPVADEMNEVNGEDSNTNGPVDEENDDKPDAVSPTEDIEDSFVVNDIGESINGEEDRLNGEVEGASEEEILNEVLSKPDDLPRNDEDNILDSILSDDGQNLENSEVNNER